MLKSKTALQELLEWVQDEENKIGKYIESSMIEYMIKKLIPKEKEQITNAFKDQCDNLYKLEMSEKYYEQNFEQ